MNTISRCYHWFNREKNLARWQFFDEKKSSSASRFEFFSWDAQQKIDFDVALTVSTLWSNNKLSTVKIDITTIKGTIIELLSFELYSWFLIALSKIMANIALSSLWLDRDHIFSGAFLCCPVTVIGQLFLYLLCRALH